MLNLYDYVIFIMLSSISQKARKSMAPLEQTLDRTDLATLKVPRPSLNAIRILSGIQVACGCLSMVVQGICKYQVTTNGD